jgi:hypothetical protein
MIDNSECANVVGPYIILSVPSITNNDCVDLLSEFGSFEKKFTIELKLNLYHPLKVLETIDLTKAYTFEVVRNSNDTFKIFRIEEYEEQIKSDEDEFAYPDDDEVGEIRDSLSYDIQFNIQKRIRELDVLKKLENDMAKNKCKSVNEINMVYNELKEII